jgi:hypothetical protein
MATNDLGAKLQFFFEQKIILIVNIIYRAKCKYLYIDTCTLPCAVRMWNGCHVRNYNIDGSLVFRNRFTGSGCKPMYAALFKRQGGERYMAAISRQVAV